jgi:hypothetical protein
LALNKPYTYGTLTCAQLEARFLWSFPIVHQQNKQNSLVYNLI